MTEEVKRTDKEIEEQERIAKLETTLLLWRDNAKGDCKRCNGRGFMKTVRTADPIKRDEAYHPIAQQCVCSARNLEKKNRRYGKGIFVASKGDFV